MKPRKPKLHPQTARWGALMKLRLVEEVLAGLEKNRHLLEEEQEGVAEARLAAHRTAEHVAGTFTKK